MAHIQGHTPMVVSDPAANHKRLVKLDEIGIAVEGAGEEIGLKDRGCEVARYPGVTNSSVTRFVASGKKPDVEDLTEEL